MGNVQAQRFDRRIFNHGHRRVDIVRWRKQLPFGNQFLQLSITFGNTLRAVLSERCNNLIQRRCSFLHLPEHMIGDFIKNMYGAAIDVHSNVLSQQRKGMDHVHFSFCSVCRYRNAVERPDFSAARTRQSNSPSLRCQK